MDLRDYATILALVLSSVSLLKSIHTDRFNRTVKIAEMRSAMLTRYNQIHQEHQKLLREIDRADVASGHLVSDKIAEVREQVMLLGHDCDAFCLQLKNAEDEHIPMIVAKYLTEFDNVSARIVAQRELMNGVTLHATETMKAFKLKHGTLSFPLKDSS